MVAPSKKEKEGDFSPSSILPHFNYFLAKVSWTEAGAVRPVVVAQRAWPTGMVRAVIAGT